MANQASNGVWWLPENPEHRVAGSLVVRDGELPRLELIGAFRSVESFSSEFNPQLIVGVADGKFVTLLNCWLVNATISFPGISIEHYAAQYILRGAQYSATEEICFDRMTVEYDALFEWAGLSGLKLDFEFGTSGQVDRTTATFAFPDLPEYQVDGAYIKVKLIAAVDGHPSTSAISLQQRVQCEVIPEAKTSLMEFFSNYERDLANFISLGVGAPVRTTSICGVHDPASGDPASRPTTVDILFLGRDHHLSAERRKWSMLFTLRDLGGMAEQALRKWFQRAETLRSVYDLYFGALFQREAYVHQRFLSLAQALESYHRCTTKGTHLPPEQFERVLAQLIDVVNSLSQKIGRDAASAFRNKLRYFNEPSLRRRLRELVAAHNDVASILIRDPERFVRRVVDTRNYYTHYDQQARSIAVPETDLSLLSDQMQFLLELCLLCELGLDQQSIATLVRKHDRYQLLAEQLQRFDPAKKN